MKSIAAPSDKISTYSEQNLTSNNDKSIINKTKLSIKHLSTPSLGGVSNDSDMISNKTHISLVPSLEQTSKNILFK